MENKTNMEDYNVGDLISLKTKNTQYTGTVMPSLDNGILVIKMKNGYNIGISKDNILSIEKIEIGKPPTYKKTKDKY